MCYFHIFKKQREVIAVAGHDMYSNRNKWYNVCETKVKLHKSEQTPKLTVTLTDVMFCCRYFLAEIVFADGQRLERNVKTGDVYSSVRRALHAAHGDYGIGVLKSSLMGMVGHVNCRSIHSLIGDG